VTLGIAELAMFKKTSKPVMVLCTLFLSSLAQKRGDMD
jgi:hypothetical protein